MKVFEQKNVTGVVIVLLPLFQKNRSSCSGVGAEHLGSALILQCVFFCLQKDASVDQLYETLWRKKVELQKVSRGIEFVIFALTVPWRLLSSPLSHPKLFFRLSSPIWLQQT